MGNMWADNMQKRQVGPATVTADSKVMNKYANAIDSKLSDMKARVGSKERMFDSKGQLNASTRKEAFAQGENFQARKSAEIKTAATEAFNSEDIQQVLKTAFADPQASQRFAADMVPLILQRLDYEGFGRQVLKAHEVAQGQIISYEEDIHMKALVIQEDGSTVEQAVKGNRKFVPEFLLTAMPTVTIQETLTRQFDIIDRIHTKATMQIAMQEDRNMIKLMYEASQLNNSQVSISGNLDKGILEVLQKKVENHRLPVDKFIMHRNDYGDLKLAMNSFEFDPVSSRELLISGIWSQIWGVNILVSSGIDEPGQENVSVPQGVVFAATPGQYLGTMPVRQELQVMPADKFVFGEFKYGWLYGELIGQAINNPRAISCGVKSGTVLPAWMK